MISVPFPFACRLHHIRLHIQLVDEVLESTAQGSELVVLVESRNLLPFDAGIAKIVPLIVSQLKEDAGLLDRSA